MQRLLKFPSPLETPIFPLESLLSLSPIYTGLFCNVYETEDKTNRYAVKIIFTKRFKEESFDDEIKCINNELECLYDVKHENIIKFFGHYEAEEGMIALVFENFGVPIIDFLESVKKKKKNKEVHTFNEQAFIKIFRGIGSALIELHAKGYVHRDIAEENILIDENYAVKIIDFGSVTLLEKCRGRVGTREFMAPEMLIDKYYNHRVDIWSFGILMFRVIYGVLPFKPKNKNLTEREFEEQYEKLFLENISKPIEEFPDSKLILNEKPNEEIVGYLKSMLNVIPNKRPEIGLLLSKTIFGASEPYSETYSINEYARNKTYRKSNNLSNKLDCSLKELSVSELEDHLYTLVNLYGIEMSKEREILLTYAKEEAKLLKMKMQMELSESLSN